MVTRQATLTCIVASLCEAAAVGVWSSCIASLHTDSCHARGTWAAALPTSKGDAKRSRMTYKV